MKDQLGTPGRQVHHMQREKDEISLDISHLFSSQIYIVTSSCKVNLPHRQISYNNNVYIVIHCIVISRLSLNCEIIKVLYYIEVAVAVLAGENISVKCEKKYFSQFGRQGLVFPGWLDGAR